MQGQMIILTMLGEIKGARAFSRNFLAAGFADGVSIIDHNILVIPLKSKMIVHCRWMRFFGGYNSGISVPSAI